MAPPSNLYLSRGVWSTSEHERFLDAIALYPHGPWSLITAHIATRSAKQVQTHAQKYQHKLMRHQRGLRKWKSKSKRPEHRVDQATAAQMMNTKDWIIAPSQRKNDTSRLVWSGSEQATSECSEDSDCSSPLELDAVMEPIEPVPFASANYVASSNEPSGAINILGDRDLVEAFDAIVSWQSLLETARV